MIDWKDPANDRRLRAGWLEGLSYPEIAGTFGEGVSASAIKNAVHRAGLTRAFDDSRHQEQKLHNRMAGVASAQKRLDGQGARSAAPEPLADWPEMPGPLPGSSPRHWLERGSKECAWPVGGQDADLLSCCLPRDPKDPKTQYCVAHKSMLTGGAWTCEPVNDDALAVRRVA